MLFERVLVHILDKYLGDYIQDLDSKKLKIDLRHGDVVLKNLYLKPDALTKFRLPVKIIIGYLQKLSLHISWSGLHTQPIKITIDGFYLLVEPNTNVKYNAEQEEEEQYDAKMQEVHKVEEYENSIKSPKHKDTFIERLELHLMRNLDISISNIHIAFEDKITKPDHPFTFGITLNYIKLHTTNSEWEHVTSIDKTSPVIYKFAELNTLCIYWNSNVKSQSDVSKENIIDDLHAKIVRNNQISFENMTYILQPSNLKIKLKIAATHSLQNYTRPMFDAQIDLEQINLNINRNQYSDLLDLLELRDYLKLQSKYIKYYETIETNKPNLRRWKFAYNVIVNEEVRPRLAYYKWENIKMNLVRCREYHSLHLKELSNQITKEEKQRAKELERQIDVFNLIFIRRTAELEVRKKKAEQKEKSWWDKFSCWLGENSDEDDPDFDSDNIMTMEEKKNLYDAIGYEDNQKSSIYPKEYVDIDLSIRLSLLKINVWSNLDENNSEFKVIAQGILSDTTLTFQRHPSTSAFLLTVDIDSLVMYGAVMDTSNDQISIENRFAFIQPIHRSDSHPQKLLHMKLETNSLNTHADYCIEARSQSLEFIYDAITINRLIECFYSNTHRNMKTVKKPTYSIYTNIKHQTKFLLNYHLRNIKALDINIDLQPCYLIFPVNGNYEKNCSVICLDFGHLIIQSDINQIDQREEVYEDAKSFIDTANDSLYIPIKIQLENIRLINAKLSEISILDASTNLIKPITLKLDVFKCIYVDDTVLPLWKISAQLSSIDCRLSDTHILEIIKLIQSIPFFQTKTSKNECQTIEEFYTSEDIIPQKNTKQTFETIENMAIVKKKLQKTYNTEEENDKKQVNSKAQYIELEATLDIPRIDLNIDKSLSNGSESFIRISFISIIAQTIIKTFDIHFDLSLFDLFIIHEQFLSSNNEPVRLFSKENDKILIVMKCLFTSTENPLFYSESYNSIENKIKLNISRSLIILQMESFLSILQFRNDIINKLSKQYINKTKTKSNKSIDVKKKSVSTRRRSSWQVETNLEQFRTIIEIECSQILDIQLQGLTLNIFQSARKISIYFILNDIRVLDPHMNSRYTQIIIQQDQQAQLLRAEISLYNYSNTHQKMHNEVDCDVNIHLTKMNIVLLYKYVDLILNIFTTNVSSKKTDSNSKMIEEFQEKIFKIRFDIIFNAPTILIPINFHSNEGILLDLGQLTLKMHHNQSFVEQQAFIFKNLFASRVYLNNNNNEIIGNIILLKCAEFHTSIGQLFQSRKMKIEWEPIDMTLSKEDYVCLMKIFRENFSEKIHYNSPLSTNQEHSESEQILDCEKNQQNLSNDQISEMIRFDFEIKKISLTLFLDESNLNTCRTIRNENSKFLHMQIETIKVYFQYLSDSSYYAEAQVQYFSLEDLHQTNLSKSNRYLLNNQNIHIDQNAEMFIISIQFKPKSHTNATDIRQVNAQLERFYLCLSPDCLMAFKDFFISSQSADSETKSQPLINCSSSATSMLISSEEETPSDPILSDNQSEIETRIDILIKTPQIFWCENQHDTHSNCLVLDFTFQMRLIINDGETHLYGSVKDLCIYNSNFTKLKESKIKYYIFQPTVVDIVVIMNSEQQKFDLHIEDILIHIAPTTIQSIISMVNSIGKLQTTSPEKKEEINPKYLFDPKPLKDTSFWFLEENKKMSSYNNKAIVEDKTKQKKFRSQQFIFNLKLIEVQLELHSDLTTKPAIALCLSDMFVDVKNWSTDINISSRIQIELALFNDHILAWEPLIDPIIDECGNVMSPWCITCSTILKDDEDENEYSAERRSKKRSTNCQRLHYHHHHHRNSLSNTEEESKDIQTILNSKNKIHFRAEHLLSITLTKTNIDLIQRLLSIFTDTSKKELPINDELVLSVQNMTGYQIIIDELIGVEFVEDNKSKTSINVEHGESIPIAVPDERLSATHLPAITEQIAKRRQQFSIKINQDSVKVDINHTWQRVYELGPSSSPNWPIQMLCDSQIHNYHQRIILSSIVKIYNRTIMPLVIYDIESIEKKTYQTILRIEMNEEYYLPIRVPYMHSSLRLFIGIDEYKDNLEEQQQQPNDFISFDWTNEITVDRILKTKNNEEIHLVIYKESIKVYSENTDEPIRTCFHVYIKLALHLINLLPINVQCSIDNYDLIDLKPSELYYSRFGHKRSVLIFTIPSYNNTTWISIPIDLKMKGHGNHHEYFVEFNSVDTQEILRMILRVDTYRESYRASLYSPLWIVNCTDLKFELKIENEKILIDVINQPFFICPKCSESKTYKKKGYIRLYSIEHDESISQWSEGFPLHVIKSADIINCKASNDRIYMVCVSIRTTTFGMSKIITFSASMAVINKLTVEIEVNEIVSGIVQNDWKSIKPEEIISFWPWAIKEGIMCIRYVHNRLALAKFRMNNKHRILLRMNDEDRPALLVEVIVTSFYGIYITFSDYKIIDAPILLANCFSNQSVTYCQVEAEENTQSQVLPPEYYVYYTWIDPFKLRQLSIFCNGQHITIDLDSVSNHLELNGEKHVFYAVFHDGHQTVLIFAENRSMIEAISKFSHGTPSSNELMSQYIEISLREISISVINDITQDDLFYITLNKSKEIWTETHQSLIKPLSRELNHHLEKNYETYIKHCQEYSNQKKIYHLDRHRSVSFNTNLAEIVDHEGHRIQVQRQVLDGLWIGCAWSVSNAVLHVRINHIQIDDQLEYAMFPVIFHPIVSKMTGTDIPGKPFIEFSLFKTRVPRPNIVHFKYFKLLVQEFIFCADPSLIMSILTFFKLDKKSTPLNINMESDLKRIEKPFETFVNAQVKKQSAKMKIYFDCIHLSPLKIHVSFSMHDIKPNDKILVEYPLVEFLLQLLNIAEVQDAVLKLHFYERKNDRFTISQLTTEIITHYEHQLLKQIHAVVLGLDVLGNPYGIIHEVADGVKSFFYEPYEGALESPFDFIEGIALGSEHLIDSAISSVAGAGARITGVISKSLATLTFDKDYESARIQRKELTAQTTSDVVQSGKNVVKDVVYGVKGVVKKPFAGAKESGVSGFMTGLSKGVLGLVARPSSGVADLTSTSFDMIKRIATHEEVVHRIRHPRHVGRDGIVRPSIAYETAGYFIFNRLDIEKYIKSDDYIAHIKCSDNRPGWLLATSKHLMFVTENSSVPDVFAVEWHFPYKDLKGLPVVKFDPDQIEILLKKTKVVERLNKSRTYKKIIICRNVGEARYIVDKITEIMHTIEL